MARSSCTWLMACSGRPRITVSSARTHSGSRARSCTTGSLPPSAQAPQFTRNCLRYVRKFSASRKPIVLPTKDSGPFPVETKEQS